MVLLLGVLVVLAPTISGPLVRLLGAAVSRRHGPTRLAVANTQRNPRRTAATASALLLGIALATAVTVFAASILNVGVHDLGGALAGDHVVASRTGGQVSRATEAAVADLPEVAAATTLRTDAITVGTASAQAVTEVGAVPPGALGRAIHLRLQQGRPSDLARGVFVQADLAAANGWSIGGEITLASARGGSETHPVTGIFTDQSHLGPVVVAAEVADRLFRPGNGDPLLVAARPGADLDRLEQDLRAVVADRPDLEVITPDAYARRLISEVDVFLGSVAGLLALSVLIAFLGVVNTLALSVTERTREIGLLRAIGMTRRQIRAMIRLEALLVAALGGFLGLAGGLVLGGMFQRVVLSQPIYAFTFPTPMVTLALAGMVAGGLLAAAGPARSAARTDVLAAIATE